MLRSFLLVVVFTFVCSQAFAQDQALTLGIRDVQHADQMYSIRGVSGDPHLLFITAPSYMDGKTPGVYVVNRFTSHEIGEITSPAEGWQAPLAIRVKSYSASPYGSGGIIYVLDVYTPANLPFQIAKLHEVEYTYAMGQLESEIVATHLLPKAAPGDLSGMAYPSSIDFYGEKVVLVDMMGGIWISDDTRENWNLAVISPMFQPGCIDFEVTMPDGTIINALPGVGTTSEGDRFEYIFTTPPMGPGGCSMTPGIHSATIAGDYLAIAVTSPTGGVYKMPLSTVLDYSIPPFAKDAYMTKLVDEGYIVGTTWDRFSTDSPWIYFQSNISIDEDLYGGMYGDWGYYVISRVHMETGEIQFVSSDTVYGFPNEFQAIAPPYSFGFSLNGLTFLATAKMMEYCNADSNIMPIECQEYASIPLTFVLDDFNSRAIFSYFMR